MNFYDILGVKKNASQSEIKKKYRQLSLKYHPDHGGDEEKMKSINEAYTTLGDPQKRKMYDMQQSNPFMAGMGGMGGMHGEGMPGDMGNLNSFINSIFKNMTANDSADFNMDGMPFPMPFGNMAGMGMFNSGNGGPNIQIFKNGRPVNVSQISKPSPIVKTINITLEDSFNGINYPIEIERWIIQENIKTTEKEKLYIPIPKGIDDKELIILENKGNIVNDRVKGDIKIFITVTNNTKLIRDGLNLIYKKTITLKEALTGFKFDLEHFNNKVYTINNDEGKIIKPSYKTVIQNLGMIREDKKGNLIIHFDVKFPQKLSKEQLNKLREIL